MNFGPDKLFLILLIVLILFGARRVPEIGASIGKGIREFKRNISDVDRQIRDPEPEPRSVDRLAAGESPLRRDEETRPEPKRLLQ